VPRIERLVRKHERVQERLFTRPEIDYCRARGKCYEHMAARFAAKEAVLKALGTGLVTGMRWTDVEVVCENGGPPQVLVAGATAELLAARGVGGFLLTMAHCRSFATATSLAVAARGQKSEIRGQ